MNVRRKSPMWRRYVVRDFIMYDYSMWLSKKLVEQAFLPVCFFVSNETRQTGMSALPSS
jgi:hypothetical protein